MARYCLTAITNRILIALGGPRCSLAGGRDDEGQLDVPDGVKFSSITCGGWHTCPSEGLFEPVFATPLLHPYAHPFGVA
jgi:hypothetical protein